MQTEASRLCDHVDQPGIARPYFSDISHAIHGPRTQAAAFLNCTGRWLHMIGTLKVARGYSQHFLLPVEIALYLRSVGRQEHDDFQPRLVAFARRCMHCHKDKWRDERSFEKLRERYLKRNSLTSLQSNGITRILASRQPKDKLKRMNRAGFPVITIGLAVCGRSIENTDEYTLLTKGFPAYARHLEKEFEYWFVLGADIGDPLFDLPEVREQVHARFNATIAAAGNYDNNSPRCRVQLLIPFQLARSLGIFVQLRIIRFLNPAKKPGPAFNVVLGAGYIDGSDYFYRPNDDTVPVTPWAENFVQLLESNTPANFGVVGPEVLTDTGGNTRILTHDFVSRVHFEIFDTYYPISLADWMMDDWISSVYGDYHTCRLRAVKVNHTTLGQNEGNPRYKVCETCYRSL